MDSNAQLDYSPQNRNLEGQWGKWAGKTCTATGCKLAAKCRGLCSSHYSKQKWANGYRPPSANPESQRNNHLKYRYGITAAQHDALFDAQKGVCAICKKPPNVGTVPKHWKNKLCVDHCHESGKVRALLCNSCNVAIGHLRSEQHALAAAEYLRVHA